MRGMKARFASHTRIYLTLWAMLMGLLLPVAALALPQSASGDWTQICTATGMKLVKAPEAKTSSSSAADLQGDRGGCPFCQAQAPVVIPSLSLPGLPAPVARQTTYPPRFYRGGKTLYAWASQPARAPPHSLL